MCATIDVSSAAKLSNYWTEETQRKLENLGKPNIPVTR